MSLEIVNGYPCFNCTDVGYAKRGIDPAHPEDDPSKPGQAAKPSGNSGVDARGPAVTFGGKLSAPSETQASDRDRSGSDSDGFKRPGSTLDVSV